MEKEIGKLQEMVARLGTEVGNLRGVITSLSEKIADKPDDQERLKELENELRIIKECHAESFRR